MALVYKDRVMQFSATTSTGTYTLTTTPASFQAFTAIGDGNTCYYMATDGTDWEVALGTYALAGTLLARTAILASSNAGAAVNWPAGTKIVEVVFPAFHDSLLIHTTGDETKAGILTLTSNLGVGNSAPNISGAYGATVSVVTIANSAFGVLELATTAADGDGVRCGDLAFTSTNNGSVKRVAFIQSFTQGATANDRGGKICFLTKSDGGALSERVVIDNAGRMGIGIALPTEKLHVAGGNINLDNNQAMQWGASNFWLGSGATNTLSAYVNGTKRLGVTTSGISVDGVASVLAGLSSQYAKAGGSIFDYAADATVGGAEADIFTDSILANTLGTNKDKIIASYGGNFVTVGTEIVQLKVYFAGTAIWDSTGIAVTTGTSSWRVCVEIIRVSSTVIRYAVSLNTSGASGFVYCTSGELTGLTLSNSNILKLTGQSSSVGSGSGDIIGRMGFVEWKSAA